MPKSSKDFEVKFEESTNEEIKSNESQIANPQLNYLQVDYSEVDNQSESTQTQQYITFDEFKTKANQSPISEILEIKKYIPIIEKGMLIDNIVSASIDIDENGMSRVNYNSLDIFFKVYMIEQFTNYAFHQETMIEELDWMLEHNIVNQIYAEIGTDNTWSVEENVERQLNQIIRVENGIENVINKHMFFLQNKLEVLINKIPDVDSSTLGKWVDKLSKSIKTFSPEKYSQLQDMMKFAKGEDK